MRFVKIADIMRVNVNRTLSPEGSYCCVLAKCVYYLFLLLREKLMHLFS